MSTSSTREPSWWNKVQGQVYTRIMLTDEVATYTTTGSRARDSLTGRYMNRDEAVHRRSIIADWNTTHRIMRKAYERGETIGIMEARKRFDSAIDPSINPDMEDQERAIRRLVS